MKKIFLLLILFFYCNPSFADLKAKLWLDVKKKNLKDLIKLGEENIGGIGQGIFWANISLKAIGKEPIYCQPSKLALNRSNYVDLVNGQIAKQQKSGILKGDESLGMLLVFALRETFPCKK